MATFTRNSVIRATPEAVFRFHERPDALRRLTPWWSATRVVRPAPDLRPGQRALIRLGLGPLGVDWEAEHTVYEPPQRFEERQLPGRGPFVAWQHRHLMLPHPDGTLLRDEIRYLPPGGPAAPWLDRLLLRPVLALLFRYRHRVTRAALERGDGTGGASAAPPYRAAAGGGRTIEAPGARRDELWSARRGLE